MDFRVNPPPHVGGYGAKCSFSHRLFSLFRAADMQSMNSNNPHTQKKGPWRSRAFAVHLCVAFALTIITLFAVPNRKAGEVITIKTNRQRGTSYEEI